MADVLTVEEFAQRIRTGYGAALQLVQSGRVRSFRLNGKRGPYRIPLDAVREFMASPNPPPPPDPAQRPKGFYEIV